jgi:hypothetical protein
VQQQIEDKKTSNPACLAEYKFAQNILDIIEGMLVKWKIASLDRYLYRTSGISTHIKMLNMTRMNESFVTVETIWYSMRVLEPPLNTFVDSN